MTEDSSAKNFSLKKRKSSRITLILVILIGVCVLGIIVFILLGIKVEGGGYSIENVVLSTDLDKQGVPVNETNSFEPSDRIICTVITRGADKGIIGMRWYYGNQLIYESWGKTKDNQISQYIRSSGSYMLNKGEYRIDVYFVPEGEPVQSVFFTIK